MRIALLALAAVFGSVATPVVAHPDGHDEYRSERRPIAELAQESVIKLVTQAKLSASWAKAKQVKRGLRTRNGAQQWVIVFQNPAERNHAKRKLYLILDSDGGFVSANHHLV